jgi:hypothetical protein
LFPSLGYVEFKGVDNARIGQQLTQFVVDVVIGAFGQGGGQFDLADNATW